MFIGDHLLFMKYVLFVSKIIFYAFEQHVIFVRINNWNANFLESFPRAYLYRL